MRSPSRPHPQSPSRHCSAFLAASSAGDSFWRLASAGSIHGSKSAAASSGKVRRRLRNAALWIEDQRRDSPQQRLLENDDAQPGLARPGHADDDAVGGQVGGVVVDDSLGALAVGVDLGAEEEAFGGHQGECTEAARVGSGGLIRPTPERSNWIGSLAELICRSSAFRALLRPGGPLLGARPTGRRCRGRFEVRPCR